MTSWRDCRLNGAGPGVFTALGASCRCGCAHCCSPPSCRTTPCKAELAAAKGQALLLAAASPRAAKPRIANLCRRLQGLRGAAAAPLLLPRAESCSIAAGAAPVCCRCLLKVDGDRKRACNCGGRGGQRFYTRVLGDEFDAPCLVACDALHLEAFSQSSGNAGVEQSAAMPYHGRAAVAAAAAATGW